MWDVIFFFSEISSRAARRQNDAPIDDEVWNKFGGAHVFKRFTDLLLFFSVLRVVNLTPSASKNSPKENDSELSDKTDDRKSGVPHLRVLSG